MQLLEPIVGIIFSAPFVKILDTPKTSVGNYMTSRVPLAKNKEFNNTSQKIHKQVHMPNQQEEETPTDIIACKAKIE